MRLFALLLTLLTAVPMASSTFAQTAPPARLIALIGTDQMKFNLAEIPAKPGERVRVRLTTVSQMPAAAMSHNFILFKAGTTAGQLLRFVEAAATAATTAYVPADPALQELIVAHTELAGGGQSVEVTFVVPNAPGDYPFICSFPGHFLSGMKGVLKVAS